MKNSKQNCKVLKDRISKVSFLGKIWLYNYVGYTYIKFVKTISVQCWSRQNQQACSGEQEQRSW